MQKVSWEWQVIFEILLQKRGQSKRTLLANMDQRLGTVESRFPYLRWHLGADDHIRFHPKNWQNNPGGKIMLYFMDGQTLPCHNLVFPLQNWMGRAGCQLLQLSSAQACKPVRSLKPGHVAFSWSIWHLAEESSILLRFLFIQMRTRGKS